VADADSAAADEVVALTRDQVVFALLLVTLLAASLSLAIVAFVTRDSTAKDIGFGLFVAVFPLSWAWAALEIRAGRAAPAVRWTRSRWKRELLWVVPKAAGVTLLACILSDFQHLALAAVLGTSVALWSAAVEATSIVARRVLTPPAGSTPAPVASLVTSSNVTSWFAAASAAAIAAATLGVFGTLASHPALIAVALALGGACVFAAWRLRRMLHVYGAPRWVVR
jgi:hypothetical protein